MTIKRVDAFRIIAIFFITSTMATLLFGTSSVIAVHAELIPTSTSTALDLTVTPKNPNLTMTPVPTPTPAYPDQAHATDGIIVLAIVLVVIVILGILVGGYAARKKNPESKNGNYK